MNAGAVTIVVMSFTAPPPPFAPLRGGRHWLGHRLRQSAEDTVAGRGGLRWRLDVHWVVVLDVPYPELAGYRISQLGRLRPPAMPCLKCFRCFKNMFQLFQINVLSVSSGCCKSRSRYCICCNGYICMLQAYV